ncbi:MAG: hypothetical protein U0694_22920 [Anaerolineae bacterium]
MSVFSFTRNPIARVETLAQQKREPLGRLRRGLDLALMVFLSLLSLLLVALEMAAAAWRLDITDLIDRLTPVIQVYLLLVILQHFRVMFGTLAQGVAALERERRSTERWDTLMMTGITSREVVLGKWWALLRARWRAYAWLALWRAGAALWTGAAFSRALMRVMFATTNYNASSVNIEIAVPTPLHFLLAALLIGVLTMMNLLFTTACALFAGIAYRRAALAAAFVARILFSCFFGGAASAVLFGLSIVYAILNPGMNFPAQIPTPLLNLYASFGGALGSLFDNGATMAINLVSYSYSYNPNATSGVLLWGVELGTLLTTILSTLLTTFLAAALYAGVTKFALRQAQLEAEKLGALKTSEAKGKR